MKTLRRILRARPGAAIVLSATVFFAIFLARDFGLLLAPELFIYDVFVRARPDKVASPGEGVASRPAAASERIALVSISEGDIAALGTWPMPDDVLARALTQVMTAGPRVVGLDVFRDLAVGEGRAALDEVLTKHSNIIVITKLADANGPGVAAPPAVAGTEQVGFNDLLPVPGGVVRRAALFLDDGKAVTQAFALRLAVAYLDAEGIYPAPDSKDPQHLALGKRTIVPFSRTDGSYVDADDSGYQFLLDFRDPVGSFPSLTLTDLLEGRFDAGLLANKVVIFGAGAESLKDYFSTPHSYDVPPYQKIYGIELHANIVSQLLRMSLDGDRPMRTPSDALEVLWILAWSIAGGLASLWARSAWRFAASASIGTVSAALLAWLAFLSDWWLPVVPSTLGWMVSGTLVTAYLIRRETEERAQLMNLFSRHVSPEIARDVWRQRDLFVDGGRPKPRVIELTVVFTDLISYTTLGEKMPPDEFFRWLNEYMQEMTAIIVKHRGVVMRYMGDAIFFAFGVPVPRTRPEQVAADAKDAVRCALEMQAQLATLNAQWDAKGRAMVGMRIGIYSGSAMSGSLGDGRRLEYSIQGDTINTAARLENFEKEGFEPELPARPCRILIGDTTLQLLDGEFRSRPVGELKLKGKDRTVKTHRILGPDDEGPPPALADVPAAVTPTDALASLEAR